MRVLAVMIVLLTGLLEAAGAPKAYKATLRRTDAAFFESDSARMIGRQLLAWQRVTGGWPKNIDMVKAMTAEEMAAVEAEKWRKDDSTTDNDATTMQLRFLGRLYGATGEACWREAFRAGVEYLLSGQMENGGWPQFWPDPQGYQVHITYNDDAMVSTMRLLRDVAERREGTDGDLVDDATRERAAEAFRRGVECILATQIVKDGKPTVWCQQHDSATLAPAAARSYELPSYCSQESVGIVKLLMELPAGDARVERAIAGALEWFRNNRLKGKRLEWSGSREDGTFDVRLVDDAAAPGLWARFYDLENCEPYVCDRDGVPRKRLEDIGHERRTGYSWYNDHAAELLGE